MSSALPESSEISDLNSDIFNAELVESLPLPSIQISSSSKNVTRTSWVWSHMPGPTDTVYCKLGSNVVLWRCKYCTSEYQIRGGTTHIRRHLNKKHSVFESERPTIIARQLGIQTAIQHAQESRSKCCRVDVNINQGELKQLLIRWIVGSSISFRMIESSQFRNLLYFLNPNINEALPVSQSTIQIWTVEAYTAEKTQV